MQCQPKFATLFLPLDRFPRLRLLPWFMSPLYGVVSRMTFRMTFLYKVDPVRRPEWTQLFARNMPGMPLPRQTQYWRSERADSLEEVDVDDSESETGFS